MLTYPQLLKCAAHVTINRDGKYFTRVLSIHEDNVVPCMNIFPGLKMVS